MQDEHDSQKRSLGKVDMSRQRCTDVRLDPKNRTKLEILLVDFRFDNGGLGQFVFDEFLAVPGLAWRPIFRHGPVILGFIPNEKSSDSRAGPTDECVRLCAQDTQSFNAFRPLRSENQVFFMEDTYFGSHDFSHAIAFSTSPFSRGPFVAGLPRA